MTIDDLKALMDLISRLSPNHDVKVEFDGGWFDGADDLRTLSDAEAKMLHVRTPEIQVNLSDQQAVVVGGEQSAQEVYRLWARTRQTRQLSTLAKRRKRLLVIAALLVLFAIVVTVVYGINREPFLLISPPTVLLICGLDLAIGAVTWSTETLSSYAIITPMLLHEYRQLQASRRYPRWQIVIAATSVLVAIAAIVTSIIFR